MFCFGNGGQVFQPVRKIAADGDVRAHFNNTHAPGVISHRKDNGGYKTGAVEKMPLWLVFEVA